MNKIQEFFEIRTDCKLTEHLYNNGEYKIYAKQAIDEVDRQECEVFEMNIRGIKTYDGYKKSMIDMIEDYYRIENCDLKYPIILAPNGDIIDGVHRVCKAIIQGKDKIRAYRLKHLDGYEI